MKLEDQVTSLEISKKLKELGVKGQGNWFWLLTDDGVGLSRHPFCCRYKLKYEIVDAFTVSELGELLPFYIRNFRELSMVSGKCDRNMFCCYYFDENESTIFSDDILGEHNLYLVDKLEANARGKMLIYLLENKLI